MRVPAGMLDCAASRLIETVLAGSVRLTRERSFQIDMGQRELGLAGKARGHGKLDPSDTAADQGADLQELEADSAAGGIGEARVAERDPAQLVEQHVGHRREPQAELVGRHGRRRGAVGE